MFCDLEKQIINISINGKLPKTINFKVNEPLALELKDFVNSIKTGKLPKANGDIGFRIVKIAEAATKSMHQKKIVNF